MSEYGEWQPIETAPKDGAVLIHWSEQAGFNGNTEVAEQYDPGEWASCESCGMTWQEEPTHWMPLPEPPEVKNDY